MILKTGEQIAAIDRAARVAEEILDRLAAMAVPGVTTIELDSAARRWIDDAGTEALFPDERNERGELFGGALCASVNDAVVHGVPGAAPLRAGDLMTLDVGIRLDGWCADVARSMVVRSVVVGGRDESARTAETGGGSVGAAVGLVRAVEAMLGGVLRSMRPGERWGPIADAAAERAGRSGFGVVPGFAGHGIGRSMHEPPAVPFVSPEGGVVTGTADDFVLRPGLVVAVEPLLVAGGSGWAVDADGWTVRTIDGGVAAGAEWMIAVTEDGAMRLGGRLGGRRGGQRGAWAGS